MAVFESFWDACAEGVLALQACRSCGHRSLLPRPTCPVCLSEDRAWESAEPSGVVDSVTRVHRSPAAGVAPGYQLALVRLADGPRMLARVVGGEVAIGDAIDIELAPPDAQGRRLPLVRGQGTLFDALLAVAAEDGDAIALVDTGRSGHPTVTYSALVAQVRATAAVLQGAGLERGDVILNWLPNVTEWVTVHLATAALGILSVPMNTRFRESELTSTLAATDAHAIVAPTGFLDIGFMDIVCAALEADTVEEGRHTWPSLRAVFSVDCSERGDAPPPSVTDAIDLHDAVAAVDVSELTVTGAPKDPAVAFTTSGTTGNPKLAVHLQAAIVSHGRNVAAAFDLTAGSRLLTALPLYGVFGYSGGIAALLGGGTLVLQPVFSGAQAAALFDEERVTHCYGPDPLLGAIVDGAQDPEQLRSWRYGAFANFSGDGPAVARRIENLLGVRLRGVYGSSECFALMSLWPEDAPADLRLQGGGMPVSSDIEVRAAHPETGAPLRPEEPGELQVRGYNVAPGYLGNEEATRSSRTDDGWFRTGDLGFIRDDGSFVYLSRIGDSLRLGGYLVDPQEIEEHIAGHPAVRRVAVVGVRTPGAGDVAVAFTQLEGDELPTPDDLRDFCRSRIAAFKVPKAIVVLDELPTIEGPNGVKVQRLRLREMAEEVLADDP